MTPQDVREFWLGELTDDPNMTPAQMKLWFGKDAAVDAEIAARFVPHIPGAIAGEFDAWLDANETAVALVILLDQFSRNGYRDTAKMYAADPKALATALQLIEQGRDTQMHPIERMFVYLPLEHAEDLAHQEHCVELMQGLAEDVAAMGSDAYAKLVDYAVQHRDIVARFGRFPHRNAILGRESTAEEAEFLKEPGSSF